MKTLIVHYLPRGERSNTKKLVDHAQSKIKDATVLDLLKEVPDFFLADNLSAYYIRNYNGKELNEAQAKSIAKMDRMTKQLLEADVVILAYPMYNFSFPAIIKAWFDSVMQRGETWDIGDKGYKGLLTDKKVLIITTSGGKYDGPMESYDHSQTLGKTEFGFMGFDPVEAVNAGGLNMEPEKTEEILSEAKEKIDAVLDKFY